MEFKFTYDTLGKIGDLYVAELTKQLLNADKVASHNLLNSLDYDILKKVDGFILELKAANYLKYVDEGRKPGSMPPVKAIEKWVKTKPIKARNKKTGRFIKDKQAAFAIAKGIEKKGIKATNVIEKTMKSILNNRDELLMTAFRKDVEVILNDMLKNLGK